MMSVVRYRRPMVVLASARGNTVEVIARLVQTSPDRARELSHRFSDVVLMSLDPPQWAGGRPLRITTEDERFIVETAQTRPEKLGRPFTHWSFRKLGVSVDHLPMTRDDCGNAGNGARLDDLAHRPADRGKALGRQSNFFGLTLRQRCESGHNLWVKRRERRECVWLLLRVGRSPHGGQPRG
jgi:hypothetical protein